MAAMATGTADQAPSTRLYDFVRTLATPISPAFVDSWPVDWPPRLFGQLIAAGRPKQILGQTRGFMSLLSLALASARNATGCRCSHLSKTAGISQDDQCELV